MSTVIKIDSLKEDITFNGDLCIDSNFLLLPITVPVTTELISALKEWQFDTFQCEGDISLGGDIGLSKKEEDFSLDDVAKTLPLYVTTGVSESRAILHIQTSDHSQLKSKYQKNFENFWQEKKDYLKEKYNIFSYQAVCNNGTKQTDNLTDFSVSAKGGLKVIFYNGEKNPISFIWMRGSGTESAFRVMCDVKVLDNSENSLEKAISFEKELLQYHSNLIKLSDK